MQDFLKKIQEMDIVTKMTIVGALVVLFIILTVVIVSCSGKEPVVDDIVSLETDDQDQTDVTEDEDTGPIDFARIKAVISAVDGNNGLVSVINVESYDKIVVKVPERLDIKDAYGESTVLAAIQVGQLVEIKYDKSNAEAYELKISNLGWEKESKSNRLVDLENQTIRLFNDTYHYTDDVIVNLGEGGVLVSDIVATDELLVRGYLDTIWYIGLLSKQGYLTVENEMDYINDILEVDGVPNTIYADMKLTLSTGSHNVIIDIEGMNPISLTIEIYPETETVLNFAEILNMTGQIQFTIVQEDATLYIDNQRQSDLSGPITLSFGAHELLVEKEGYLPWTTILYVSQSYDTFTIDLDVQPLMIKVDEPIETELYIDDILIGVIPVQVPISGGAHVIRLEKAGYYPKTQNIVVDIETGVFEINFPELIVDPNYVGSIPVRIDNPVGCELYIGAELIGIIPVETTLAPGDYQLTIRKDGYNAKMYAITINEAGAPYQYTFPDLVLIGQEETTDNGDGTGTDSGDGTDGTDTPTEDAYVPN